MFTRKLFFDPSEDQTFIYTRDYLISKFERLLQTKITLSEMGNGQQVALPKTALPPSPPPPPTTTTITKLRMRAGTKKTLLTIVVSV